MFKRREERAREKLVRMCELVASGYSWDGAAEVYRLMKCGERVGNLTRS